MICITSKVTLSIVANCSFLVLQYLHNFQRPHLIKKPLVANYLFFLIKNCRIKIKLKTSLEQHDTTTTMLHNGVFF